MEKGSSFPALRQVVLDSTDARRLAEFYRQLLGFVYRPGDDPPDGPRPTQGGTTGSSYNTPRAVPSLRSNR